MIFSADKNHNVKETKEVHYEFLNALYFNSRISIRQLAKKFKISQHTLSKNLKTFSSLYEFFYTLDLDTNALGFSEARILTIKFDKIPDIKLLKKRFNADFVVQNAYFGIGDFDLILHIICKNQTDYIKWLFRFRVEFNNYKPKVKVCTLNDFAEGFLPINNKLLSYSDKINLDEKKILAKLLENSRMKIGRMAKDVYMTQMKIVYILKKLQKNSIIKKFTYNIQNPDKRIFLFYTVVAMPNENHRSKLLVNFLENILYGEDQNQTTTDYSVVCDTSGHFDSIFFCNFKDGETLNKRGPPLLEKTWKEENPIIEKSILTELIKGKWPFNANSYSEWLKILEHEKSNPTKFTVYK
jgi:DNA-binding Lrp family transcriptional regulator